MRERLNKLLFILKRNYKTLLGFEIGFRILEILIIFPLTTALLYLSIALSPYQYITNEVFFDYLLFPSTIIIILFTALILGITLVIELTFLSYLFYYSHLDKTIKLKTLIYFGGKEVPKIIKKYHIFGLFFALFFFLAIELSHIVGIASTIQLPDVLLNALDEYRIILYGIIGTLTVLYILFFETIYNFNILTIDRDSLKDIITESRDLLKKHRPRLIGEFILLNSVVNLAIYLIYLLIIGLVAFLIFLIEGQAVLLGLLLTALYSIYLLTSFIVTITLIPINFAWISTWYYRRKKEMLREIKQPKIPSKISLDFLKKVWVKRLIIFGLAALLVFNGVSLYVTAYQSRGPIQLFNQAQIIAHRGSSNDAPENTIAAIEKALEDEADAIELDVRLTSDNVPILMHDARLGRTTNDTRDRLVSSVTYAEIQELDAGSWFSNAFAGEKVPTLEEAIQAIDNQAEIFIELKVSNEFLLDYIVELGETYNVTTNIKVLSFSERTLEELKEKDDRIETVLLILTFFGNINLLIENEYIDHIALEYTLAANNTNYIERIQLANKQVYVYTVNDSSQLGEINDLEIDGVITDLPITAREIVYTRTTKSTYVNILKQLFPRQ